MDADDWRQVNITYPEADPRERERHAADHLRRILPTAEARGDISAWWFIRKGAWRIRYLRTQRRTNTDPVHTALSASPGIATWIRDIYEPEVHAFGGTDGMDIAHTLFHHDSRHLLPYLADDPADRREHAIILPTALMRAAGLDLNEQGDVWARIAEQRAGTPNPQPTSGEAFASLVSGIRQLILGTPKTGAITAGWLDAFTTAGSNLADLRAHGTLTRGLRGVTALHVIFHWNRIGLDPAAQASLALTAKHAILD